MTPNYDENNLFAQMLRGTIEPIRVYEDAHTLAIMDLMPQSPGHVLVIPRTASRNLLDAESDALQKNILNVQKIAKAAKKALNADGVTLMQFNEAEAGQTIFHLHFHIIPRYKGKELEHHSTIVEDQEALREYAQKIKEILAQEAQE